MFSFLKARQVLAIQGSLSLLQSVPGATRDLTGITIDINPLEPELQLHRLLKGRTRGNGSFLALLFRHAADKDHVAHLITSEPALRASGQEEWPFANLTLKISGDLPTLPSDVGLHHYWAANEYESPFIHPYRFAGLQTVPSSDRGLNEYHVTFQQIAPDAPEETIENLFGERLYNKTTV